MILRKRFVINSDVSIFDGTCVAGERSRSTSGNLGENCNRESIK